MKKSGGSEEKSAYTSISKTKTFAPPTSDGEYLFAHLLRNLESACIKARRYGLAPHRIALFLKRQDFDMEGREAKLNRPSAHPLELSPLARGLFNDMYRRRDLYRATGVVLLDLVRDTQTQYSLFEDPLKAERIRELMRPSTPSPASTGNTPSTWGVPTPSRSWAGAAGAPPTVREQTQLYGETRRKHLGLPLFQADFPPGSASSRNGRS